MFFEAGRDSTAKSASDRGVTTNEASITALQRQLHQKLGSTNTSALDAREAAMALRDMLSRGGPLLLVLDDLWSRQQLCCMLAGDMEAADDDESATAAAAAAVKLLPPGSRVLLTSSRQDIVALPGRQHHAMKGLSRTAAIQLFCSKAFDDGLLPLDFPTATLSSVIDSGDCLPLHLELLAAQFRSNNLEALQVWCWTATPLCRVCSPCEAQMF